MTSTGTNGISSIQSAHSVPVTVERLGALLRKREIKVFAIVDHAAEASTIGMAMPPTSLMIFGNPAAGTPLMLAAPSTALDLPLKLLVAEQPDGRVTIAWNDPEYLRERHGFPNSLTANIAAVVRLAAAAAEA